MSHDNAAARKQSTPAPAPFNKASADIALRSSDDVEFLVSSHILSEASPIFADMFTLPQPSSDGTRPVVDVTEDSETLERLLRLCYPIAKRDLWTLDDIVPVLQAASKYEMEWPLACLSQDLLTAVSLAPFKVWAVACRTGLSAVRDRATVAIPDELKLDRHEGVERLQYLQAIIQENGADVLHGVTAGDYFRLREVMRTSVPREPGHPPPSFVSGFKWETQSVVQVPADERAPTSGALPFHQTLSFDTPRSQSPDVVLMSSEGTSHPAHRLILSCHSACLDGMLAAVSETLGDSVDSSEPRLLQLKLELTSRTLCAVLCVMYHGEDRLPSELPELASVIAAGEKYGLTQVVRGAMRIWDKKADQSPLDAYFISTWHNLHSLARTAARAVINGPIARAYSVYMEDVPALAYHRLLLYYDACTQAVRRQVTKSTRDWDNATQKFVGKTSFCNGHYIFPGQAWMGSYLDAFQSQAHAVGPGAVWLINAHMIRSSARGWPAPFQSDCMELAVLLKEFGLKLSRDMTEELDRVEIEV